MMTLHKLIAGDGYLYLMRHIAKGDPDAARAHDATVHDAAAYYTAEGNPPGVWLGRGASVLGLTGSQVTEDQMRNLFGLGAHPDADRIRAQFITQHVRAGMTVRQVRELARAADRHAQLGRAFAGYKPLAPLGDRVTERVTALEQETGRAATPQEVARIRQLESRRAAGAVAGYDLVFSPVKSVALVWALDERAGVREAIRLAHEQAMTETIGFLQQHAAHTRTGAGGLAQVDTTGLVAVAFTHYDSRAGDPNLHTHVAVSNKIQGVDGRRRALDARGLHAMAVAASEHYNTRLQTHVTDRLAVTFEAREVARGRQPVMEIAGIEQTILDHFSRRRAQLEARYDQLVAGYRATHGADPSFGAARALADRANLETRRAKGPVRSLADMRTAWREDLQTTFGPGALGRVMRAVPGGSPGPPPALTPQTGRMAEAAAALVPGSHSQHTALVEDLAARVVSVVEGARSTWTVWNLRAETERTLRTPAVLRAHHLGHATPAQLAALVGAVTARAAGPGLSVSVEAPTLAGEPVSLRRADGAPVFTRHGDQRYTSQAVLDAERRLLDAATALPACPAPSPSRQQVEQILGRLGERTGVVLDAGQTGLVTAFAADPRTLVVGLGPAGTGKTTAMRALKAVLDEARTGRLIPLATSAHAASVLAADLDAPAENVHKFLSDHLLGSRHRITLRAGDVVVVDEAGMAGTPNLARILSLADHAGAKVRLLGDDRQLAAVESGGALRLLAEHAGAVELDVVHRFADPAEAAATLRLRTGDHQALAYYQARGRIRGGSGQDMTDAAYTAWLADVTAGKTSVLATTTTADVTRLAARARADRVATGDVEAGGVTLHDGNTAGAGDWIVTRANDRRLTGAGRTTWVRNGDPWRVVHRRGDGALTVQHLAHGARLVLPPGYVADHVELLYATTAHRVQGATVDTAHALITPEATREHLYVLATRARQSTHLYVQTHQMLPVDEDARADRRCWDPAGTDPAVILQRVLDRQGAEMSASQVIRDAQNAAASLATLVPRHQHAVTIATTSYYTQIVRETLNSADATEAERDGAFDNLLAELRRAHHAGWQPEQALARAVRDAITDHARQVAHRPEYDETTGVPDGGSRSMTRLIVENLRDLARSLDPPAPLHRPGEADLHRYAALLAERGITLGTLPVQAALHTPITLRAPAFDTPAGQPARTEITPNTYRQDLTRHLPRTLANAVLDEDDAVRWRTLQHILRRTEHAGHTLDSVLTTPAIRTLTAVGVSPSGRLAQALTRHLDTHPTPALTGPNARTPAGRAHAWTHLAWTLKAAEAHGADAADLLPEAPQPTGQPRNEPAAPRDQAGMAAAWLHVQTTARTARPHTTAPVLPWVPDPVPGTLTDPGDALYLHQLRGAIAARLDVLRCGLGADLPAWAATVHTAHAGYAHTKAAWLDQVQIAAAFRDQYPPARHDPDQPLGAHPEPAPHTDRPHQRAHTDAATALTRAWDIAHPVGRTDTTRPDTTVPDTHLEIVRHLATSTWHALNDQQKTTVAATVLARTGTLPDPQKTPAPSTPTAATPTPATGTTPAPGPAPAPFTGLDEALTSPQNTWHLYRALVHHGHLDPLEQAPDTTCHSGTAHDPARKPPAREARAQRADTRHPKTPPRRTPTRPAPTPAPQPTPRPQTQPRSAPHTPAPAQGTPQPGIEEHRPRGPQHRY